MNKIKDTIRKIAPFVKNYRKGFIFAIILIRKKSLWRFSSELGTVEAK